jgi:GNAT superfamily N-acetyltransferase
MEFSPLYGYVRSLQLEGTYPQDAGCFIITSHRISAGWGYIDESAWPYDRVTTDGWPPLEPPGVDAIAKRNRLPCYLRARNLEECKIALATGWLPQVALRMTNEWYDAPGGEISTPAIGAALTVGVHAVCLVGYDDNTARVTFVNSWGAEWGDGGCGSVSYEYFERFLQEGWVTTLPYDLAKHPPFSSGKPLLNWGIPTPLGIVHGVEVYDPMLDVRRGWAFARQGCDYLEVEELFVRPDHRGRGVAATLCAELRELSDAGELPLRLWVPAIDDISGPGGVDAIAKRLGLALQHSGVVWARRVAA